MNLNIAKRKRVLNYLRYSFLFYRNIFFISGLSNFLLGSIYNQYGLSVFHMVLLGKFLICSLFIAVVNRVKKNEFYFYFNMGISKMQIWGGALLIDLSIFFTALFFIEKY